jgi:Putative auto-transporter adhesin, head GIN domain
MKEVTVYALVMKRISLWMLAPTVALMGCTRVQVNTSNAGTTTKTFSETGFKQLKVLSADDVEVTIGKTFSVSATGPQKLLDKLELKTEGDVLTIDRKADDGSVISIGSGPKIRITMPAVSAVFVEGSGSVSVDSITGDQLQVDVTGSGEFAVADLQIKNLEATIEGSGDATFAGSVASTKVSVAGSGSFQAEKLTAGIAAIEVDGSGDAALRVTGSASGALRGSGNITIRGTRDCDISEDGSGNVDCKP